MSGGKKKKSSSGNKSGGGGNQKKSPKEAVNEVKENNTSAVESVNNAVEVKSAGTGTKSPDAFAANPSVDVLDRLAPPILFFPPNVAEEYLNRFCPAPLTNTTNPENSLLADEGFPDREIPVMRRLLAMMAGIMSKASAASARTYYSRVAGTEGRRNGYFQQNLNTSVFNLFSTLSAAGNPQATVDNSEKDLHKDLHLSPAAAFTAKDGEPLRGYPSRLMKFWRQLSPTEQLRLVKEEHAALTNSWIESRQNWCLCAHCKHRRMTISDLTDCLYQTYCEELEAFLNSNGQGSSLYSPNLTNSMEPAAKARRFLFKSLSVVGEQALLPRYNQFILRLEAFSSMAFSSGAGDKRGGSSKQVKIPCDLKNGLKNGLKSAALQASKEFLQRHGKNATEVEEMMNENFLLDPKNLKHLSKSFDNNLSFKIIQGSEDEDCVMLDPNTSDSEMSDSESSDLEDERDAHQGGIQSEDDDDLIDEETDLPIDESELMLPGGASFPLLPVGDGPVQWSESSRIECGRTVFLMFASEMFQYRLTAAFLAHQTKLRQLKLLAEVEEEERLEKEKRAREEREKKEKLEAEKKKKAAKKEKAAAKANGSKPKKQPVKTTVKTTEKTTENTVRSEIDKENVVSNPEILESEPVSVKDESESMVTESVIPESVIPESMVTESVSVETVPSAPLFPTGPSEHLITPAEAVSSVTDTFAPLFPPSHRPPLDDDDFDPTLLVEQLSKEMNRFELHSVAEGKPSSPPGFAPPPGFAAEPKHLGAEASSVEYQYSHRPPFAFEPEYPPNHSGMMFSPPGYHQYQHGHNAYYNSEPNYPNYPNYHSYPSYQPPSPHNVDQFYRPPHNQAPPPHQPHEQEGQSRFQSFFSKSIFGPSTFFSQ